MSTPSPAIRLQHLSEYYFSKKMAQLQQLKQSGKPIINLGIGNPDLPPPPKVIEALQNAALDLTQQGYQPYKGTQELREAISQFYQTHYQVSLNANAEILPLFGAKEGIMHISAAYLNREDSVLVPNPGYASYSATAHMCEANVMYYDLTEKNNWYPDFEQLENTDLSRVKIMWVNYPNMPTGARAEVHLYEKLIAFGKKHNILIVNDNPYSFILTKKPMSILQIDGAKETAVELNSLSKTFNMAGWRVGMMVGNAQVVQHALTVKSNMDSGMYYGLQMGAVTALNTDKQWMAANNKHYENRREIVWKLADALQVTYQKNAEGFFVWAKIKDGTDAYQKSDEILEKYNIFVTPGSIFGSNGNQYLRFSLCAHETILSEALSRIS